MITSSGFVIELVVTGNMHCNRICFVLMQFDIDSLFVFDDNCLLVFDNLADIWSESRNNFTVSARFKFGKTHRFDTGKTMSSSVSHTISFIIASVPFTIAPSKSILRRHITRAPMHIGNCSNILAHSFSSLEGSKLILHPILLACTGLKNNDRAMPTF
ncbi:unnamed protein product [Rotaria sp. Silwood2]|nr:unnamed protein product [Rotaria sp. Silwood2]